MYLSSIKEKEKKDEGEGGENEIVHTAGANVHYGVLILFLVFRRFKRRKERKKISKNNATSSQHSWIITEITYYSKVITTTITSINCQVLLGTYEISSPSLLRYVSCGEIIAWLYSVRK